MEFDFIDGRIIEKTLKPTAEFLIHPVRDREASDRQNRAVYVDQLYIKLRAQGVKDAVARRATEHDKTEYAEAYKKFLSSKNSQEETGTALELLIKSPSDVASLRAIGVNSLESLAKVEVLPSELRQYKAKAKAFVELSSEPEREQSAEARGQIN